MHSILPITVTTALCLLTFPSLSSSTSLKGVDVVLQTGQTSSSNNEEEVKYVENGKSIDLTCFGKLDGDLRVQLDWFKNRESLSIKCASDSATYNEVDKKTGKSETRPYCALTHSAHDEDEQIDGHWGRKLTLTINKVLTTDFGPYECRGNYSKKSNPQEGEHISRRMYLWETITATRQNEKGKRQRSLLVYDGDYFNIYCNYTGLKTRDDLSIFWYKDGQDITNDLWNGTGNFSCAANITDDSDGRSLCKRVANISKHRGVYTCEVKKKYSLGNDKFVSTKYSYMIRVKPTASILFPGIILVVECIVLAIITVITWKNTSSGDQVDGNDWEDEDEYDPEQNNEEREEEEEELTSKPLTGG